MAKTKSKPATPEPPAKKFRNITIRASVEWAAWLDGGAEHCRTDVAKLVDAATAEYLKARDYKPAPPTR